MAAIAASGLFPGEVGVAGRVMGAAMIAVFGFLFVTVSSRLTGEIGSSSNPISGMTVATLLLTCLVFVLLGWVGPEYRVAAVSIAGIVCVAASNGGTTSQDLKTGYLIGATPRSQQWAILVGALTSAVVIGSTLLVLNQASTVVSSKAENLPTIRTDASKLTRTEVGPDGKSYKVWWLTEPIPGAEAGKYLVDDSGQAKYLVDPAINGRLLTRDDGSTVTKYDAPKARLMALIIDGIMQGKLPWGLVILGALDRRADAPVVRAGPGVCRRGVPAAVDLAADLRRRDDPRPDRPPPPEFARRVGLQPRRPPVERLHRRRRHRRDRDRLAGADARGSREPSTCPRPSPPPGRPAPGRRSGRLGS